MINSSHMLPFNTDIKGATQLHEGQDGFGQNQIGMFVCMVLDD